MVLKKTLIITFMLSLIIPMMVVGITIWSEDFEDGVADGWFYGSPYKVDGSSKVDGVYSFNKTAYTSGADFAYYNLTPAQMTLVNSSGNVTFNFTIFIGADAGKWHPVLFYNSTGKPEEVNGVGCRFSQNYVVSCTNNLVETNIATKQLSSNTRYEVAYILDMVNRVYDLVFNGTYYNLNYGFSAAVISGHPLAKLSLKHYNTGTQAVWFDSFLLQNDASDNNVPSLTVYNTTGLLTGDNPLSNDDIHFNITCTDADAADTITGYVTIWNGTTFYNQTSSVVINNTKTKLFTIASSSSTKGVTWNATYWCNDATANSANSSDLATVINTPPSTPTTLGLNDVNVTDTLTASCGGSTDHDGDTIIFHYNYFNINDSISYYYNEQHNADSYSDNVVEACKDNNWAGGWADSCSPSTGDTYYMNWTKPASIMNGSYYKYGIWDSNGGIVLVYNYYQEDYKSCFNQDPIRFKAITTDSDGHELYCYDGVEFVMVQNYTVSTSQRSRFCEDSMFWVKEDNSNYTTNISDAHNAINVTCESFDGTAYSSANFSNISYVWNSIPYAYKISWNTTGGFNSSNLNYKQVIDWIRRDNNTDGDNERPSIVNINITDPLGNLIVNNASMTYLSSVDSWQYNATIELDMAGDWHFNITSTDSYDENIKAVNTTTITVSIIPTNTSDTWYGYSEKKIFNTTEISNLLSGYGYDILELETNLTLLDDNWGLLLTAINDSYDYNAHVGINILLNHNYTDTTTENNLKNNITSLFPELISSPYSSTISYVSIEFVNLDQSELYTEELLKNTTNNLAREIINKTNNMFPVYTKGWGSSTVDSAYSKNTTIQYNNPGNNISIMIINEYWFMRNTSSLNRIYVNLDADGKEKAEIIHDEIIARIRGTPNTSMYFDNSASIGLSNKDLVVWNNLSTDHNYTIDISILNNQSYNDVWDDTHGYMIENNTDNNFLVEVDYQMATIILFDNITHIIVNPGNVSDVYTSTTSSESQFNYTDGTRDDNIALYGDVDFLIELFDPHYKKTGGFITYYGWLNASRISINDWCDYEVAIIGDHNNAEVDRLIQYCNATTEFYTYISVGDYDELDQENWLTNKKGEVDEWLSINESLHLFVDGLDYGVGGSNFSNRMKQLVDYVQVDKSRKVILNSYTAYDDFATWGMGGIMKESCINRWNGTNASNPTSFGREDWNIDLERARFFQQRDLRVFCQSFDNRSREHPTLINGGWLNSQLILNYTELQNIYFASKVLGYEHFYLSEPDFNYAHLEYVYDLGTDLSNDVSTDDNITYYRRYSKGIVYYDTSSGKGWFNDGRTVTSSKICFDLYDAHADPTSLHFNINSPGSATAEGEYVIGDGNMSSLFTWENVCTNITNPPVNGRYLVEAWLMPRSTTIGDGMNLGYQTNTSYGEHSFIDSSVTDDWSILGDGSNWAVNISVSETKKVLLDTSRLFLQKVFVDKGITNITLSSNKTTNTEVWSNITIINSTYLANISYWNPDNTSYILLNASNTSTCDTNNPEWGTTDINGQIHKACYESVTNISSYYVRVGAPSLSERTYNIQSDTYSPLVTLISPSAENQTNNNNPSFSFQVYDDVEDITSCLLSIDGNNYGINSSVIENVTTTINVNNTLFDGRLYWSINCTDRAGNTGTNSTYIIVDTNPPIISFYNTSGNTSDNTPSILFSYYDYLSLNATCVMSFNGTNTAINNTVWNYTNTYMLVNSSLDDDVYNVSINCTDLASNKGSSSITLSIDTTPPIIRLISPLNYTWIDSPDYLYFNVSDNQDLYLSCRTEINSTSIYYYPNSVENSSITSYLPNTSFEDKVNYNWTVTCNDNANNTGTSWTNIFHIDTTQPVTNSNTPTDGYETQNPKPVFNITCSDNLAFNYTTITIGGELYGTNNTCGNNTYCMITANHSIELIDTWLSWTATCYDTIGLSDTKTRTIKITSIPSESPTVISGGGGGSSGQQSSLETEEEMITAITICEEMNGTTVNIKGVLYCKTGDKYVPLEKLLTEKDLIKRIGSVILPSNPTIGFAIITLSLLLFIHYFNEYRTVRTEKRIRKAAKKEEEKDEKEKKDDRRRRSDGGYY